MERLGKVIEWNDARGFGFVSAVGDAETTGRVFFHVRDYEGPRRPEIGELVKFAAAKCDDGRWRATRVRRAVASGTHRPAPPRAVQPTHVRAAGRPAPALALVALVLAYVAGIAFALHHGRLPDLLPFWLIAANGLTLLFYYGDKTAAQRGEGRVPESTLHLLEAAGGWPAALLAQRLFRHKSRKPSYRSGFRAMVVLHVAIVVGLAFARVFD